MKIRLLTVSHKQPGWVHEACAEYEKRLPREWVHLPLGAPRSMGIHESQSLSFEMQLGRSRPFLELIAPLVRTHLGGLPLAEVLRRADTHLPAHHRHQRRAILTGLDKELSSQIDHFRAGGIHRDPRLG